MATISFNGQEYDSPDAMPPEVRQLYEMMTNLLADKNQDGVPDIFAGGTGNVRSTVFQTSQFIVDGKAYNSLDELPADARQKYEQELGRFDADRNGIPDLLEHSSFGAFAQSPVSPPVTASPAAQPNQEPKVTVIGEPQPAGRVSILLVAGVVLLLLALYLFTR